MKKLLSLLLLPLFISLPSQADEIRIARQFGIDYLPLIVMEKSGILQKHLDAAGLKDTKVKWLQLGGPVAINEALVSGNLDLGTSGPAPTLILWDKTKSNIGVKAVAALNIIPMHLVSNNPEIKSIRDFTSKDKIALPGAKISTQSIVLQIASEKAFGEGKHNELDKYTVTMSHQDATTALKSGSNIITAHFSTPPYSFDILEQPGIHAVATSEELLGEPSTGALVFSTAAFHKNHPEAFKAFSDALNESIEFINADKEKSAEIYAEADRAFSKEQILKLLNNPQISFTTTPAGILPIAEFMQRTGIIKNKLNSLDELFF